MIRMATSPSPRTIKVKWRSQPRVVAVALAVPGGLLAGSDGSWQGRQRSAMRGVGEGSDRPGREREHARALIVAKESRRRSSSSRGGGGGRNARAASASAQDRANRAGSVQRTRSARSSAQFWWRSSGFFAHQLADDGGERRGHAAATFSSGSGSSSRWLKILLIMSPPSNGGLAGQGEIERAADAVEVAAHVGLGGVAELLRGWRSRACPRTVLARVSPVSSSRARARPMSSSFTSPSGVIMMFDGLISRWTSPARGRPRDRRSA